MNTDSLENMSKSGQPVKTTEKERRSLITMCKKDPHKSARKLKCEWFHEKQVSISTIKRILRKYNLFGRRPARKPFFCNVHKKNRLQWCRNYRDWTSENLNNAIFADECQILLHPVKKAFVRRPINARFNERNIH